VADLDARVGGIPTEFTRRPGRIPVRTAPRRATPRPPPRSCRHPSSTTGRRGSRIKLGPGPPVVTSVSTRRRRRRAPMGAPAASSVHGGVVMVSRRNGELKRSVLSALAAMVAAAIPSLVSLPAQAEPPSGSAPSADAPHQEKGKAAKHEKREAKHDKKARAAKGQKAHPKQEAHADKREAPAKPAEAQADAKPKPQPASTAATK